MGGRRLRLRAVAVALLWWVSALPVVRPLSAEDTPAPCAIRAGVAAEAAQKEECPQLLASGASCQPSCADGFQASGRARCWHGRLSPVFCVGSAPCTGVRGDVPFHGGPGDCPDALESGAACRPSCDEGYEVIGETACLAGSLALAACRWRSLGAAAAGTLAGRLVLTARRTSALAVDGRTLAALRRLVAGALRTGVQTPWVRIVNIANSSLYFRAEFAGDAGQHLVLDSVGAVAHGLERRVAALLATLAGEFAGVEVEVEAVQGLLEATAGDAAGAGAGAAGAGTGGRDALASNPALLLGPSSAASLHSAPGSPSAAAAGARRSVAKSAAEAAAAAVGIDVGSTNSGADDVDGDRGASVLEARVLAATQEEGSTASEARVWQYVAIAIGVALVPGFVCRCIQMHCAGRGHEDVAAPLGEERRLEDLGVATAPVVPPLAMHNVVGYTDADQGEHFGRIDTLESSEEEGESRTHCVAASQKTSQDPAPRAEGGSTFFPPQVSHGSLPRKEREKDEVMVMEHIEVKVAKEKLEDNISLIPRDRCKVPIEVKLKTYADIVVVEPSPGPVCAVVRQEPNTDFFQGLICGSTCSAVTTCWPGHFVAAMAACGSGSAAHPLPQQPSSRGPT